MTQTNYSHSHEQQISPDRAAMLMRRHTFEAAADYVSAVALHVDPDLWTQPTETVTASAASVNVSNRPEQPRTTTAGNLIEFAGQAEQLAAARQQIDEVTTT